MKVRRPIHAGSWYDNDANVLRSKIEDWLNEVPLSNAIHSRAIIGPHAGFSYCGHVLAHAFKQVQVEKVKNGIPAVAPHRQRIFMLGPSHHFYTRKCLLSPNTIFASPLGDFLVDEAVYAELKGSGMFDMLTPKQDEAEHSLEMHLPFIAHLFEVTIVPIVVGSLSSSSEAKYGDLLAPYLKDESNLFALSSDFCHWGSRFGFTPYDESQGKVHQYIEYLDRAGMQAIETGQVEVFESYLRETGNTICGRHAIAVYLQAMKHADLLVHIEFRKYDQSSRVCNIQDSSVSYAAAVITAVA